MIVLPFNDKYIYNMDRKFKHRRLNNVSCIIVLLGNMEKDPSSSPTYKLNLSGVSTNVSGSIYIIQRDTGYLTCNTVSNPPPATDQYKWTRSTGGSWTHKEQ